MPTALGQHVAGVHEETAEPAEVNAMKSFATQDMRADASNEPERASSLEAEASTPQVLIGHSLGAACATAEVLKKPRVCPWLALKAGLSDCINYLHLLILFSPNRSSAYKRQNFLCRISKLLFWWRRL